MLFSYFSRELTQQALVFEIFAGISLLCIIYYGVKHYRFFFWRFFALALGVFCFEGLTWAMWNNAHLGNLAYIHNDISWVMTLIWTGLIFLNKFLYDATCRSKTLIKEFSYITLGTSMFAWVTLWILKTIGVFSYSTTMDSYASSAGSLFGIPLEAMLYLPVFIFTSYTFYKYWELAMYHRHLFSHYSVSLKKDIVISACTILLIGYLMHPLLQMTLWSTFVLVIAYLVGLTLTSLMVGQIKDIPLFQRYIAGIFVLSMFGMIIVSLMMDHSMISLSQSIKDTHTVNTVLVPWLSISDVEFVGIILFSCLLIAIVRYFKIVTDNSNIKLDDKKITFQGWKSLLMK